MAEDIYLNTVQLEKFLQIITAVCYIDSEVLLAKLTCCLFPSLQPCHREEDDGEQENKVIWYYSTKVHLADFTYSVSFKLDLV